MRFNQHTRNLILAGIVALFLFGCVGSLGLAGIAGYLFLRPIDRGTSVQIQVVETATPDRPSVPGDAKPAHPALAPTAQATPTPQAAAHSPEDVIVPTRDLRDLALRLRPDVESIPLVVNQQAPNYNVGDRLTFWVSNTDDNSHFQIEAELVHKTDVAYAWVEMGQPYDAARLRRSVDRFSQEIYPRVQSFFGSEWTPGVDADPRLHILHATRLGRSVAGYYSSADQFSRLANPFSNEKEMFYINLESISGSQDYEYYETILAHEFQHMIHWHNDRNEETWVNEGLSELAQEVAGYAPETYFPNVYASVPDTQLNTWSEDPGGRGAHYGNSYLFMAYLLQRFGDDLTKAIVAHPANGVAGVDEALTAAASDLTFDDVFADWIVANYVDAPETLDQPGVYGYRQLSVPRPSLAEVHRDYPVTTQSATVYNYGVDYIGLQGYGDATVHFQGETQTRLADTAAPSGAWMWWSNRGDDANSRLTRRFDFSQVGTGTPIELSVAMWYDIEEDYDYGYVSVSRDGERWQVLSAQNTTDANPTGNSFGPGYTGDSDGDGDGQSDWITERFDLSQYAGEAVWVRFEYVTDDTVNGSGWFIDDVRIPAIDYVSSFEEGTSGWESEGWLRTDNRLPQEWLVQIFALEGDRLSEVRRIPVDASGRATINVTGLDGNSSAILTISGRTPVTTEPAQYQYSIER